MEDASRNDNGRNVILQDLDRIEAEREALRNGISLKDILFPGEKGDLTLWRRLFSFARPYLFKIVISLLLSTVVGLATAGKLWFVKEGLRPIVDPAAVSREASREGNPLHFLDRFRIIGAPEQGEKPPPAAGAEKTGDFDPDRAKNRLLVLVVLFLALVLFEQGCAYFQAVLIRSVGHRIVMDIRNALFARVMSLSLKFHNKNHSGKLISRLTNDLQVFGSFFTHIAVGATKDIFMLIACMAHLVINNQITFMALLLVVAVVFIPVQLIGNRIRRRDKLTQRSTSLIYSTLSEALSGQKIVKAFGTEDYEYEKFRQVSAKTYRNSMKTARLRSRTQPVIEVVGAVVTSFMMIYLGWQVIEGTTDFETMTSVAVALVWSIGPLRRLAKANNNIQQAFAAADRVATLLYSEPEIADAPDAVDLDGFHRCIRYDHVYFEHEEGIPVLRDIDFTVRKGEVVAVVGPSGSGKTTLADLLPRFYNVKEGRILIDGIDIRKVKIRSLRRLIGIVSQETVLFNDTVRMNISYGIPDCDLERVVEAARAANAHEFIMEMEEGYDTLIGERGVRLSGGQRQRLAIARALLKNPPILILDEATSSLDSEAERQVQDALFRLMEGRTALVIAHRLSTVRNADRILVMRESRIVEEGDHDTLMARGGEYARLYTLQSEGVSTG